MVWIEAPHGQGTPFGPYPHANKDSIWRIVAFDTEDGGKKRYLQSEPAMYSHVMITPTGTRVIWSDCNGGVWICDWNGENKKKLVEAVLAVGVAENPPGTEWVYTVDGAAQPGNYAVLSRYLIDDPSKKEIVWDKTPSNDKWEFTRDGKAGASGLPWPNGGVAHLPNGTFKNFGVGCTPGVANDLSYAFVMIPNGHRGIILYNANGGSPRQILFAPAPGVAGTPDPQFWWASTVRYDPRFFTFGGPHPSMTSASGDIYFAAFTPNHDSVAQWVRVTSTPELETCAYALIIKPGSSRPKKPVPGKPVTAPATAPAAESKASSNPSAKATDATGPAASQ
jgi:hypothetical protein